MALPGLAKGLAPPIPVGQGMSDLGTLPGMRTSIASGINDGGQVVGCSETADGSSRRVFSWTVADGMEDVGPIDGGPCDASVNNLGQVVWSPHLQNMGHVFRWTHSGGAQDLGFSAYAVATNSSGQISGTAPFQNQDHAFLWSQAGGLQDLGTINGWEHSDAFGMNETGDVVGSTSSNVVPAQDAFVWTQNGGMRGLGVSFGTSYGINIHDQAVGWGIFAPDNLDPYVWSQTAGVIDIDNELPVKLRHDPHFWAAVAINDAGKIALADRGFKGGSALLTPKMKVSVLSSVNPSHVGQSVTFTASVTSVQGAPPDGETVVFKDGSHRLKAVTLVNGTAAFTTSTLAAGIHSMSTTYTGDTDYASSKSAPLQQVVNQ